VFHGGRREKQVRLTLFDNEPMARLAEQRLRQAGIRCVIRSLRGGPGLWGSAYNLPHDLCVFESDQMRAREVLDLAPRELQERERLGAAPGSRSTLWLVVAGIIIAVLVLGIVVPVIAGSGG
tara:strand:- start:4459 stop:4824 length:366 start_codon:yes stop_codon:yes gene_type:complete